MSIYNIFASKDTFVYSEKSAKPQCRSELLPVGKTSLGFIYNSNYLSYIYFNLSDIPENDVITSAVLKLHFFDPPFEGIPPEYIGIQLLAGPFKDCRTNYNNRPPIIPEIMKKIPIGIEANCVNINVTDFVKAWLAGRLKNYGFALVPIYKHANGVLLFCSSNSTEKLKCPLLTVKTGDLCKNIYKIDREEIIFVNEQGTYSSSLEVWNYSIYSFIVKNIGTEKIMVQLQDSPDNKTFINEEPEIEIVPGQSQIMVNNYFTRYVRLKFRLKSGESGKGQVKIWLQGRQ